MSSSTQPPDEGGASHSAMDQGSASHLAMDQGSASHSAMEQGNASHSAMDLGSASHSAMDQGSASHSAMEQGSASHSAMDQGSTSHSAPVQASASHSAPNPVNALASDADSIPDSPPPVSPLHWENLLRQESYLTDGRGSPSIIERMFPLHGDDSPTHQRRPRQFSPQNSDAYTPNDILYQMRYDIENQLALDPRGRLDLMIRNTLTRFGDIVGRELRRPPQQPDSEESSSNGISSASEDSNQSLPESHVQHAQPAQPALPAQPAQPAQPGTDKIEEPAAKLRKIDSPQRNEEFDGETCPICLDIWGNSGSHRLVALRCGHLFGAECVERWLKAQPPRDRSCPTCKTKAGLKDLRFIYARKLLAADTTEITRLQNQVYTLQAEKSRTEIDLQTAKMTQRVYASQVMELKEMLEKSQVNKTSIESKTWRFALEKNLEMCKDGGCRVLAYNCRTYELYVSQKSVNYLFPGYGIRKVSCVDYTLGQFLHLHPKPIRDITYSQPTDLLLSVGLDSTAKIVERGTPTMTVNTGFPLWSCSWDRHNTNEFYVGGVGGMIHHYDYRNLSTTVRTLSGTGDISPVVAVCSTDHGLLSCQLNSCWLWETKTGSWIPKTFPVTGTFMSMCYDNESNKALLSTRPKGSERSKLAVCTLLPYVRGGADINVDYMINGSSRTSVMSRATFCKTPTASWVAAHSESDATLHLHGLNGARSMSLPAADPALDVRSVDVNGVNLLAALSDSRLRIYKAVQTTA